MEKFRADIGLLILRLSFGGIMLFSHGLGKLLKFSALKGTFPDPLGVGSTLSLSLAVFAEFFCALFVVLGILTRPALVPLMITMIVAAGIIHGADPWSKKEMAVLFLTGYLSLWLTGPGRFSLDFMIRKRL
ncbi:MAG: DoxX family protein [Bdellovibrionales bacterium]|nr:DoxX family protein [Bdellovibrionales bacterium]